MTRNERRRLALAPEPLRSRRQNSADWLILTAIVLVAVAAAFPLAWMVLTSLKTPAETMQTPPVWIPATPSLDAYRQGLRRRAGGTVLPQFGDHRHGDDRRHSAHEPARRLRVRQISSSAAATSLFAVVIATMFLPPIVTLIPLYRLVGYLRIDGSLAGVIVPNLANAFGIFLMRQFIRGVPDDLIDAGRMDGASELRIVFSIVAPSVTPAIAALALFAFVYHWNSYLWPLTVLQGHTRPVSDRHQP